MEATVGWVAGAGHRWLVTGGIGSGKSAVCEVLEGLGWFRVEADKVGHEVLQPGGPGFDEVAALWPEVVTDGEIDRRALGRVVFGDPDQLGRLEAITHPLIFGRIEQLIDEAGESSVVVETPLRNVTPSGQWTTVVVDATDRVRLERVVRRGLSEDEALERMRTQPSRSEWLAVGDLIVPNHEDLDQLSDAVREAVDSCKLPG